MNEEQLRDLLVRSAETVRVSPPPVVEVAADARRRRSSRRLAVAAAATFVVGAVVAFALVGRGQGAVEPLGPQLDLPSYRWGPPPSAFDDGPVTWGDMGLVVGGVLELDERGCVVLDGAPLVWPRDWSVHEDGDGFAVVDGAGEVVAHDGDRVRTVIDYDGPQVDHRCTAGARDIMYLKPDMATVTVTEIALPTTSREIDVGETSRITGRLTLDAAGCLRLGDSAAVWPDGYAARVDEYGLSVLMPDGQGITPGNETVSARGVIARPHEIHACTEGEDQVLIVVGGVRLVMPPEMRP